MVFENILNPVFTPFLNLPTLWAVILLSFLISLIITLIYKYTTDQNLMKSLKEEMKDLQKGMKELKNSPERAMQSQKKIMQLNGKYMMQSMKSMLYSFIPIILIFGWMNSHLAYDPVLPGQEFATKVTFDKNIVGSIELSVPEGIKVNGDTKKEIEGSEVEWRLSGNRGEYLLEYITDGKKYDKDVIITENLYKDPIKKVNDGTIKTIEIENKKKILLNLFGWELGWLGTYIIFAILFSIIIRKVIKVY
ncbi:DUF106 domain-containing protein [Candidatus Woesearchaeota archaeon]|nr:DUF106 domain-containing protein [Candidatus Woesearchaeota archaeon]